MYNLEWPLSEIQGHRFLNAAKMTKYSLVMTPTPRRVAGCIISIRPTYSYARAFTYLLIQNNQRFGDWPVINFPDFSANDLSSVLLHLVWGHKIINVLYGWYFTACSIARFALLLHATCLFFCCCTACLNRQPNYPTNIVPFIKTTYTAVSTQYRPSIGLRYA